MFYSFKQIYKKYVVLYFFQRKQYIMHNITADQNSIIFFTLQFLRYWRSIAWMSLLSFAGFMVVTNINSFAGCYLICL